MDKIQALTTLLCKAINKKHVVEVFYKSKKDRKPRWRKVEPYLVVMSKGDGKIKMVGCPLDRVETGSEDKLGHYLFDKLGASDVKILADTFHSIRVHPSKVFNTPNVKVICRVRFLNDRGEDIYGRYTVDYD